MPPEPSESRERVGPFDSNAYRVQSKAVRNVEERRFKGSVERALELQGFKHQHTPKDAFSNHPDPQTASDH